MATAKTGVVMTSHVCFSTVRFHMSLYLGRPASGLRDDGMPELLHISKCPSDQSVAQLPGGKAGSRLWHQTLGMDTRTDCSKETEQTEHLPNFYRSLRGTNSPELPDQSLTSLTGWSSSFLLLVSICPQEIPAKQISDKLGSSEQPGI